MQHGVGRAVAKDSQAMQFHVVRDPDTGRSYDFVLWVKPPVARHPTYSIRCSCKIVFPVIMDTIPDEISSQNEGKSSANVCKCLGDIIE